MFVYLFICLRVYLFVYLFVCLFVCLFTSVVAAILPDVSTQKINIDWLEDLLGSVAVGGDNINVTSFSLGISSGIRSTSFS